MRVSDRVDRSRLIAAAMQRIPCDLTVRNVRLVNVFTGEVYPADVDVLDGRVVRVRTEGEQTGQPSAEMYDGKGAYLLPGFIDAHMHVESTMMIPENLSRAVVPWGTTTVCTDPHEIANVMGVEGVRFMLNNAKKSALRQFVLAPSCVPAAPGLENAGAEFGPEEMAEMLDMPGIIGIAEVMDFVGVIADSPRMHDIVEEGVKRGAYLQGHGPMLSGKELAAYRIAGPKADHESLSGEEVREKLRNGMHINLRASSFIDNVPELAKGFMDIWKDFVSICTDDVHAEALLESGHVNNTLARAMQAGVQPIEAIKMATLNTAREYGFDDLGAIAPGYIADMQLVADLDGGKPQAVFIDGKLVAEDGVYIAQDDAAPLPDFKNSIDIKQIVSADDFRLAAPEGCGDTVQVNVLTPSAPGSIFMKAEAEKLPVKDGYICIDGMEGYSYLCVLNRYGTGDSTVAILKGFGPGNGAFAATVSHDSHNMAIVYSDTEDAYAAYAALAECGGGVCAVRNGAPIYTLPLPVAGLMSTLPCAELAAQIGRMQEAARELFGPHATVLQASLLSLPCIPGVVVSDRGIVDGMTQQMVPCFV